MLRCRGRVLERLLHVDGRPVVVRAAQTGERRVLFGARAGDRDDAERAITRMRFALGVDDDLREFCERFQRDPLIGASVRRAPWLRISRRPVAFEAFAWAVCEQLIDAPRAAAIERRIVYALGPRCPETGLRDVPTAAALGDCPPARLESFDLAGRRAVALVRVAREVASGRIDLEGPDHEVAWRRLLAVPTIGRWTVEMLAAHGQGRYDVLPAGDLGYPQAARPLALGRRSRRARRGGRGARAVRALRRLARSRGQARPALAGTGARAAGSRLSSSNRRVRTSIVLS